MQLRRHSLLEASLNTASGFILSVLVGLWVYPAFGIHEFQNNLAVTSIFTIVSIIRSYIWRRIFNARN